MTLLVFIGAFWARVVSYTWIQILLINKDLSYYFNDEILLVCERPDAKLTVCKVRFLVCVLFNKFLFFITWSLLRRPFVVKITNRMFDVVSCNSYSDTRIFLQLFYVDVIDSFVCKRSALCAIITDTLIVWHIGQHHNLAFVTPSTHYLRFKKSIDAPAVAFKKRLNFKTMLSFFASFLNLKTLHGNK